MPNSNFPKSLKGGGWWLAAATLLLVGALIAAFVLFVSPGRQAQDAGGPTSSTERPTARAESPAKTAKSIAHKLDCASVGYVYDDMYFYDNMFGINCHDDMGDTTVIRVYEHSSSIPIVLQDWKPLISSKRPLVTGDRWFVVGPREPLSTIAKEVQGASAVSNHIKADANQRAAKKHRQESKCVSFVTGALVDRAVEPNRYAADKPYLDKAYPGLAELVQSSLSSEDIKTLRNLQGSSSYKFEAYLSRFGERVKDFCRERPWSKRTQGPN